MRVTERDVRLLRDLALSHALTRDQVMALGYFASVTRSNTRLRELREARLIRKLETPFFGQSIYAVSNRAIPLLGPTLGRIVSGRGHSPRFLQHALATANLRIHLLAKGASAWRFEQQLSVSFDYAGSRFEVRPDGLAISHSVLTAVEVDMGHVAPSKVREKLRAFDAFVSSGECEKQWQQPTFELLLVTTGRRRAAHLARLAPDACRFSFRSTTFHDLGIALPGAWS